MRMLWRRLLALDVQVQMLRNLGAESAARFRFDLCVSRTKEPRYVWIVPNNVQASRFILDEAIDKTAHVDV